jgi:methylated-DNA-protein-cysteine methyltransferase-like protein
MFEKIQRVIMHIPRGRVATYGQVAVIAGFPGAARQVAWALRSAKGLPWHRVVGAKGKILLTGNNALEQRTRLEMEGVRFVGPRVDIETFQWKTAARQKKTGTRPRRKS